MRIYTKLCGILILFLFTHSIWAWERFTLSQLNSDTLKPLQFYYLNDETDSAYSDFNKKRFLLSRQGNVKANSRLRSNIAFSEFQYLGYTEQEYYWVIRKPLLKHVSFYFTNANDSLIRFTSTGSEFPFGFRELENRYFIFKITPQPDQIYRLYASIKPAFNQSIALKLQSRADFESWYEADNFILAGFLGLLLLSVLLCFLFFFNYRDTIFLRFIAFLIPIFLLELYEYGFISKYMFSDQPLFNFIPKGFFMAFAGIGFLLSVPKLLFPLPDIPDKLSGLIKIGLIAFCIPLPLFLIFSSENYLFDIADVCLKLAFILTLYIVVRTIWLAFKLRAWHRATLYFLFSFAGFLIFPVLRYFSNGNMGWLDYFFEISTFIQLIFLFLALIYRNAFFIDEKFQMEIRLLESKLATIAPSMEKYKNSKFTQIEVEARHKFLLSFMESQKPYLDTEMNLNKLAQISQINTHLLSQIINQVEEKNFFDFINDYRVKQAQQLLSDPKFDNHSVEGIGYECGFNSKATFYSTFKKITGQTPAEFKKMRS